MARDEGGELLRVVDRIRRELGPECPGDWLSVAAPTLVASDRAGWPAADPDRRNEAFVGAFRRALAGVAAAAGATTLADERQRAVCVALDGVELVTRTQLAMDQPAELRKLLPSFVYLVALPVVQQDEALALSELAAELVRKGLPT